MAMTNDEIIQDFANLFGSDQEEPETEKPENPDENPEEEEKPEEESEEEPEEEESGESEEEPEEKPKEDKKQAKQNYAFAQQRQQIREQENFIKNLGKLIGMEGSDTNEIRNKVQEVLLQKQSQEQNVPVDILQRLQAAEAVIQENQEIKRQNEVQNAFANLVEKHGLSQDEVETFTQYLIDEGKNPLENPNVDIAAEYLKLHYDDMIQLAVSEALKKEQNRKSKVDDHSSGKVPGGGGDPEDKKINSVKDLDAVFSNMDL